jgi:peptidoglycan/xylan/chitin deacetylase (PgdA/CDA1 family)
MKNQVLDFLSRMLPFAWLQPFLPKKFILYGHIISDNEHFVRKTYHYPDFREFDSLAGLLRKAGYEFADFETYLKNDNKKKVLLSIDDGFKVVKDEMHQKLKVRGIPYVLFITTKPLDQPDYIFPSLLKHGNEKMLPSAPLFLSKDEIYFLKKDGVHIGFHTKSHQIIKEETNLLTSEEIVIDNSLKDLFSEPVIFAYPYAAPANFQISDQLIRHKTGAGYFFDTKGFFTHVDSHFYRVCIDSPLGLKTSNNAVFMIKRQILQLLYRSKMGK